MKPKQFSPLGMYGKREVFERRLNEGYTEIALGEGDWIETQNPFFPETRIVRIWAFFHPKKFFNKIATYQHPKAFDGGHTIIGQPFEQTYTSFGFRKYCEKNRIKIGEKRNLAEILGKWSKEEANSICA